MSWWTSIDPFTAFRRMMHQLAFERLRSSTLPLPSDEGTLPPEAELSDDERHEALEREAARREHERIKESIGGGKR